MTTCDIKCRTVYLLGRTDKSYDGTEIYVGSTSLSLSRRLQFHRGSSRSARDCNSKLYVKMREVGLNNWDMVPLLSFACDRKTIFKFEKEWCNVLNADLNTYSPILDVENRKKYLANYREFNIRNNTYHCNVCEKSFGSNSDLNKHFDSLKHQHAHLNSLD